MIYWIFYSAMLLLIGMYYLLYWLESGNEDVAATAAHLIGELSAKGLFAWEELAQLALRPVEETWTRPVTLPAVAIRAMMKLDRARALREEYSFARSQLETALRHWLSDSHREAVKQRLNAELSDLQT